MKKDAQLTQDNAGQAGFFKKVFKMLTARGFLFIVSLFSTVVTSRILAPEGKGYFSVALTLASTIVQFCNLGFQTPHTYYLSRDKTVLSKVMGNSLVLSALSAVVSAVLFVVFLFIPGIAPVNGTLLFLALAITPVQLYYMFQAQMFIGLDELWKYNLLEFLSAGVYPALLLIISFAHPIVASFAFGIYACCTLGITILGNVLLWKTHRSKPQFSFEFARKCLPFGFMTFICALLSFLVLRADIMMINYFLDETHTGLYTTAVSIADIINAAFSTIGLVLFPEMAKMTSRHKKHRFMSSLLAKVMLIMLVPCIIGFAIAPLAIRIMYGQAFALSAPALRLLIPGIFFWGGSALLSNYFASQKWFTSCIVSNAAALVANILLNALFIPMLGINGAAIASSIAYSTSFLIQWVAFLLENKHRKNVENRLPE